MMKTKVLALKKLVSLALLLSLCAGLLAACGGAPDAPDATDGTAAPDAADSTDAEKSRLEENKGSNAVSYPYSVRTDSATWYLSKADMELMGEQAYLEGLWSILENQDADFADARAALQGCLREDVPPVDIYTDFSGKAEESRFEGGYYYSDGRGIRLFTGWNAAGVCLLHEYVHYLSFSCSDSPVREGFWAEALADYVSKFVCENRMSRAVRHGMDPDALQFYLDHGSADPETGEFDLRRYTYGCAEMMTSAAMAGQKYLAVSDSFMIMSGQRGEHPTMSSLSYYEAACFMEYLIETYGRDTVFSHWDIGASDMADVYGKSYEQLYDDWRLWNADRCAELGLILDKNA